MANSKKAQKTSGLYYKHIATVNDDSKVSAHFITVYQKLCIQKRAVKTEGLFDIGNCDNFVKRKIPVLNETKCDEISFKPKV